MRRRAIRVTAATLCACGALVSGLAVSQTANAPAAAAPDLNGFWTHGFSLGFDPPPEGGPGPVQDIKGKPAMRAMGQFVIYEGDANNPILQPWAAAAVKKRAEEE